MAKSKEFSFFDKIIISQSGAYMPGLTFSCVFYNTDKFMKPGSRTGSVHGNHQNTYLGDEDKYGIDKTGRHKMYK
ncbi:MAG: hypothetical protein AB7D06_15875 [Pedobacter sp.]